MLPTSITGNICQVTEARCNEAGDLPSQAPRLLEARVRCRHAADRPCNATSTPTSRAGVVKAGWFRETRSVCSPQRSAEGLRSLWTSWRSPRGWPRMLCHHTALEVHGVAQSLFERFTYLTWTKAKRTAFLDRWFVPVRPRAPLHAAGSANTGRKGRSLRCEILVTSLERAIADVLDRPGLAGVPEECGARCRACRRSTRRPSGGARRAPGKPRARLEGRLLPGRPPGKAGRAHGGHRTPEVANSRAPVFMDRASKGRLVAQWGLIVPTIILDAGEPLR